MHLSTKAPREATMTTTNTDSAVNSASPDLHTLHSFFAGDSRAGMQLFDRHVRTVRRYFLNKVRQAADVDDLVHQVFAVMFDPGSGFRGARNFAAYLFGVQQNVLRAYYRLPLGTPPDSSIADAGAVRSTWLAHQQQCRQLLEALRRLPIPQQEVLELHYWEEMTNASIGELLDVPVGTVASRLRLAKQALLAQMRLAKPGEPEVVITLALDTWAQDVARQLRGGG